jgi:uncharacterized protein (TIGR00645 family)
LARRRPAYDARSGASGQLTPRRPAPTRRKAKDLPQRSPLTRLLESGLFAARWLLAPFYVGLVIALLSLLGVFFVEVPREIEHLFETPPSRLAETGILMALTLIDLSLTANLLILVILSGYKNFVSRLEVADEWPAWMGSVDFAGLKIKLISSIVAISSIALLRTYLELEDKPQKTETLLWEVLITLTFVIAGVLLAVMDYISARTNKH